MGKYSDRLQSRFKSAKPHQVEFKGLKNGNCNTSVCQKPGATFFNKSTRKYYCRECATEINYVEGRRDTLALYGTELLCEEE